MRYRIETERYYDVYDSQRHDDVDEYDWLEFHLFDFCGGAPALS